MARLNTMTRPRLQAVEPSPDYTLRLTFIDGTVMTVDKREAVFSKRGLAPLQEVSAFMGACIGEDAGWAVEWPALDIQIGADTLWLDAQAQNAADENTRVFAQWRARHGLSLSQAAQALGITSRTVSAYGTGARPVPRYIALACKGWEAEHRRAA